MNDMSEAIDKIAPALVAMQSELGELFKDSDNKHFNSQYASLAAVIDVVRPTCAKHGLSIVQLPRNEGDFVGVTTRMLHTSGQWVQATAMVRMAKYGPQDVGSVITYMRRYTLASLACVAQEDDDGNVAQASHRAGNPAAKAASSSSPKEVPDLSLKIRDLAKQLTLDRDTYATFCRDVIGKASPAHDNDRRKLIAAMLERLNEDVVIEPDGPEFGA